jgi:hypothetical protein
MPSRERGTVPRAAAADATAPPSTELTGSPGSEAKSLANPATRARLSTELASVPALLGTLSLAREEEDLARAQDDEAEEPPPWLLDLDNTVLLATESEAIRALVAEVATTRRKRRVRRHRAWNGADLLVPGMWRPISKNPSVTRQQPRRGAKAAVAAANEVGVPRTMLGVPGRRRPQSHGGEADAHDESGGADEPSAIEAEEILDRLQSSALRKQSSGVLPVIPAYPRR